MADIQIPQQHQTEAERAQEQYEYALKRIAELPVINTTRQPVTVDFGHGLAITFPQVIIDADEKRVEPVSFNGVKMVPPPEFTGLKGLADLHEKYGKGCTVVASVFTYRQFYKFGHEGMVLLTDAGKNNCTRNAAGHVVSYKNLIAYTKGDWEKEMAVRAKLEAKLRDQAGDFADLPEWPETIVNVSVHHVRAIPTKAVFDAWTAEGRPEHLQPSADGVFCAPPSGIHLNAIDNAESEVSHWRSIPCRHYARKVGMDGYEEILAKFGPKCTLLTSTINAESLYELTYHEGECWVGASGGAHNSFSDRIDIKKKDEDGNETVVGQRFEQVGSMYFYRYRSPHARKAEPEVEEIVIHAPEGASYGGPSCCEGCTPHLEIAELDEDGDSEMPDSEENNSAMEEVEDLSEQDQAAGGILASVSDAVL